MAPFRSCLIVLYGGLVSVCLSACITIGAAQTGSQWQGTVYPLAGKKDSLSSRFLILDTGGSGGGFGQGDVRAHLLDVCFLNENYGWACGWLGVFVTRDGGLTWSRVKPPGSWTRVQLSGPDEIWLGENPHGGGPGQMKLWQSTDSGKTWLEHLPGKLGGAHITVRAVHCWVLAGDYQSYRSDDDGRTWIPERFGGLLHGIYAMAIPGDVPTADGYAVFVLGHFQRKTRLVKSTDGGKTWAVVRVPGLDSDDTWSAGKLFFVTSRMGWIGGGNGRMLFTTDGGETWVRRDLPSQRRVTALWFDQLGRGFVAVQNPFPNHREAVFETSNGGRSWTPVLSGVMQVNAFFGLEPGRVWGVGDVPHHVPNDLVIILVSSTRKHPDSVNEP